MYTAAHATTGPLVALNDETPRSAAIGAVIAVTARLIEGYQRMAQGCFAPPEPSCEVDRFGVGDYWCVRGVGAVRMTSVAVVINAWIISEEAWAIDHSRTRPSSTSRNWPDGEGSDAP